MRPRLRWLGLLLLTVLAVGGVGFMNGGDVAPLLHRAAPLAMLAAGQVFVLAIGGIDLSVGAVAGMAGVVLAAAVQLGVPIWGAAALALAVGAAIGVVHAGVIIGLGVPAFVATLASAAAMGGLIAGGTALPGEMAAWLRLSVFEVPVAAGLALLLAAAAAHGLHRRRFGRQLLAIGNDAGAARLSGMRVGRVQSAAYVLSAVLAAVAGLLDVEGGATGADAVLGSLTAALIGGASLWGAGGSIGGSLLGAVLLAGIGEAAGLGHVDPLWQPVWLGGLIVVLVAVDARRRRKN